MGCCSRINCGFDIAGHVVRTTEDVESAGEDPFVPSTNALNMLVHVTQRVPRFCNCEHGCQHKNCSVGHIIHCSNTVFAVCGKLSRFVTNETLSIGLVGIFLEICIMFGLLVPFPLFLPFPLGSLLLLSSFHVSFAFAFGLASSIVD